MKSNANFTISIQPNREVSIMKKCSMSRSLADKKSSRHMNLEEFQTTITDKFMIFAETKIKNLCTCNFSYIIVCTWKVYKKI